MLLSMPPDMSDNEERRIEEWYCFLTLAHGDLIQARDSLKAACSPEHRALSAALARDAVICYARPFSKRKGEKASYELKGRWIPAAKRELHSDLIRIRKGFIAHTDLRERKPRAARWHGAGNEGLAPLVAGFSVSTDAILRDASTIIELIEAVAKDVLEEMIRIEKEPPFGGSMVRRPV